MTDQEWQAAELERRLGNWWRWIHERDTVRDIAPCPMWRLTPRGRRAESPIPMLLGEALDTDEALKAMPEREAAVLVAAYCWRGRRIDHARRLRLGLRTYYDLLERAQPRFFDIVAQKRRAHLSR